MMTVYTRPDKRFHRAHRRPGRRLFHPVYRFAGKMIIAFSMLSVGVYACVYALDRSLVLQIDTLDVQGNKRLSDGEALALVATLSGQNILSADLNEGRINLLTSSWVQNATLRRVFPSTVEIVIEEREPLGLGRFGSKLYLIDPSGQILDEYGPRFADLSLPIIDGLSDRVDSGKASLIDRRVALASRLITSIHDDAELMEQISQVDVTDPHDAVILLQGDPAYLHLGEERFVERLKTYMELLPSLRERVPSVDYVDLRFEQRVYVRPTGTGNHDGTSESSSW